MKTHYKKSVLLEAAKNAGSIVELLSAIGLRAAGGNYATVKRYLTAYKIDTSHFEGYKRRNNALNVAVAKRVPPIESVLVASSDYSRTSLKRRLYELGLKTRQCEMCGQGEDWNGGVMSLILDHTNGIHNDNRLENLRILCPNCNATLDTHCSKNKRK